MAPDTHRRVCSHHSFCMSFLFYSESSHRGLDKTMKECVNILSNTVSSNQASTAALKGSQKETSNKGYI